MNLSHKHEVQEPTLNYAIVLLIREVGMLEHRMHEMLELGGRRNEDIVLEEQLLPLLGLVARTRLHSGRQQLNAGEDGHFLEGGQIVAIVAIVAGQGTPEGRVAGVGRRAEMGDCYSKEKVSYQLHYQLLLY